MKKIKGFCAFGIQIKWHEPSKLILHILKNNFILISKSENHLLFTLQHNIPNHTDIQKVLNSYFDGIGFLLDFPIVETSQEEEPEFNSDEILENHQQDNQIIFKYDVVSFDFDTGNKQYSEKIFSVERVIKKTAIEILIARLSKNKRLSDAVYHYLHAIEEPELFLVSLYRSYERIKEFRVIPKKEASNFRKLANFEPIWGSRHASDKQMASLRFLTSEERVFCLETIKAGIMKYSESIDI